MSTRFNGPYKAVNAFEAYGEKWDEAFFGTGEYIEQKPERGLVLIINNVDADGNALYQTVMFRCPCQKGETVNLPINTDKTSSWGFEVDEQGLMTLSPSLLQYQETRDDGRVIGCGAHFFIRAGMVEWCSDSKNPA